ncbi:MAG: hypothetical protein ACJATN_002382 [Neolewinella sp.]|jgi:hypothetical protein
MITFTGQNFDILAGIAALIVWYFTDHRKMLSPTLLEAWYAVASRLLLSTLVTAFLSM